MTDLRSRWLRRARRASLVLAMLAIAATAPAAPWQTSARLKLRAGPSTRAATLAVIPARAVVEVATCVESWCVASWEGVSGWVAKRYVAPVLPQGKAYDTVGRGYVNVDGQWVPSPRHSPSGPPAGASAQCRDGTYSFSRHRRGTCSHHGGVRRWL